jgi:flagellar biogenesis protein FliO
MNIGLPGMAAVTVFAGMLAVVAAAQTEPPANPANEAPPGAALHQAGLDDPWAAVEPKFSARESRPLERRSTERAPSILAGSGEKPERPWARTLGALAGVVGLIVLLAWGYRAMVGGNLPLGGKARRPGLIEVISKTPLSARQSLCLVRIGPRLVLVGQSHETLRALDVIDDADLAARLAGEAARKRPDASQAEFRACLEREAKDYQDGGDSLDETVVPDAQRIAEVRQGVSNAIRRIRRAVAGA